MGYYIRVLGTKDVDIHINELIQALEADNMAAKFELDQNEMPGNWTILNILNQSGEPLAQIERNLVAEGELGKEELDEFKEIIQDYKPTSAVNWLASYFDKVKVIYAFQILNAAFEDDNFEIVSAIKTKIWNKTNGILQADNEGFANEDGYHILWQFSDDVTGDWSCAVINANGGWDKFVMNLGDTTQRKEFQEGKIPHNVKRL